MFEAERTVACHFAAKVTVQFVYIDVYNDWKLRKPR
jgi:hypothetical protein